MMCSFFNLNFLFYKSNSGFSVICYSYEFLFFLTKINDIHLFKLIEYIDTIQI